MSNQSSGSSESGKKRNKKQKDYDLASEPMSKEEQQIARFLRLSCPNRQGNCRGEKVDFFIASKLVDCLMDSKWGPGLKTPAKPSSKSPLLANRQACLAFMQRLLNKQLFYRAIKVYKDEATSTADSNEDTPSLRKRKVNKESQTASQTPKPDGQVKRKFKLDFHDEQKFVDSNEPYVWVYDQTSTKTYIIGSLLILGAIGICLFPLWPSQVREGVYYVSLAGASFLGAILGLAVFKYILFAIVWAVTFGSVSFWLFPNLTEDVGFFESFVPVYKCTNSSSSKKETKQQTVENETNKQTEPSAELVNENQKVEEGKKSVQNTPNLRTQTKEISKSTLEIDTISSDSPSVRRKASTKDDDDFELVGDEDLDKN